MISWIDIVSLIITTLQGASSVIKQVTQKHPGLTDRAQACYADALKEWATNKAIRKQWETTLPTAASLITYLTSSQAIDTEVNSLLKKWVDKLLADEVCSAFILEARQIGLLSSIDRGIQEILGAIKAPYNTLYTASSALRAYFSDIIPGYHIPRQETDILYNWLSRPANQEETQVDRIAVLLAGAGLGKTVILKDLQDKLEQEGTPVLGIKSDIIFDTSDITLDKALNLGAPAAEVIKQIALDQKTVILIDQIDALSAVLSADRRPLASITTFINEVTRIPNVRVIVSCRQYDFDYESAFVRYKHCEKVRLQELTEENVAEALMAAKIPADKLSSTVKTFLRSPLNLFLYCRLADHTRVNSSPTLQDLYGSLWKEIIIDKAGANTTALVQSLDEITSQMSRRQVLTINNGILPSETAHQRQYLISNALLREVGNSNNIQFVHQTLFEYTAARLFVEKGRTLDSLLQGKHQGLFLRPQLKQILDYQRSVDPQSYAANIREILFAKDPQGKDKYRFQLKQLVITTLAYNPSFLDSEKSIIRQLLKDPELSPIILSAITTEDGIDLLWEYICDNGGVLSVDKPFLRSYLNAVCVVGETDIQKATAYLTQVSAVADDAELRYQFVSAIDSLPVGEKTSTMLWGLIRKYGVGDRDIEVSSLLNRLLKYDPQPVGDFLNSLLKDYVKDNTNKWSFDVPHNFETIVEHLQQENPIAFLPIGLQMLDTILTSSEEFKGDDIRSAAVLYLYNRRNHALHFDDWLLDKLMDTVEAQVEAGSQEIDTLLDQLAATDITAKHLIALAGWRRDVPRYKDRIYNYLVNTLGKKFHASYLEYQHKKLFESVFPLLTPDQQGTLIRKVDLIEPDWEKVHLKGEGKVPILKVGYTKAQYYSLVPDDILKTYKAEYKAYQTLRRKYKNVEVREPNHIETRIGWASVPESKVLKMSKKDLINLAKTYDKDNYLNWDTPTRRGNALEFASRAEKEPDFMCDVYSSMLDDDPALDYFVVEGLEGLRKGQCEEAKVSALIEKTIALLPDDVNTIDPTVAFQLIREADTYIKNDAVPPKALWEFLFKVALTAKEEDDSAKERVDVNDGINQLRGSAVEYLVQLYYCSDYTDRIFDVLDNVARTGNVATRCALLFQAALLLNASREKTLNLFLTAVSRDYNVNLLRMQIHNVNPLVYLAKTDFDKLVDYFEACIKEPASHETNVVILFASWLRDTPGAEELTFRMADSSLEGKFHLVRYISNVYKPAYHSKCQKVLLRYLDVDEKELGRSYDEVADTFKKWPRRELKEYLSKYLASPQGRYAGHDMNSFLKEECRVQPEDCLTWISALYNAKKGIADRYQFSEYTQILIEAYNSICKYDNQSPVLEDAMDMFDELLRNNIHNRALNTYLKEVS